MDPSPHDALIHVYASESRGSRIDLTVVVIRSPLGGTLVLVNRLRLKLFPMSSLAVILWEYSALDGSNFAPDDGGKPKQKMTSNVLCLFVS